LFDVFSSLFLDSYEEEKRECGGCGGIWGMSLALEPFFYAALLSEG
jgi:hypothetical protein